MTPRGPHRRIAWLSRVVVLWSLAALSGACRSQPADPLAAVVRRARQPDVNVLFLLVDTLRADHLSAYGYERDTSPTLATLARGGIRFAHVRSQSSWTKPSMASLWTARYPVQTGILRFQQALPAEATLPAETLRAAGFRTAGLWRNGWVAPNFGFDQGFDVYYRPVPGRRAGGAADPSASAAMANDADMTQSAIQFVRTFGDQRFFLYLHYMDVHQYVYTEETALFGVGYADAYDNAIRWVDRNINALLGTLQQAGLLERTLVVVGADHGEAFKEHGTEGHGRNLHVETTEVPLILVPPGGLASGIVVGRTVRNVDLWPTLFDLLGLPAIDGAQGRSLLPVIRAATRGEDSAGAPALAFSHLDQTWGQEHAEPREVVSVTRDRYRLIHPLYAGGRDQLFDLEADPGERHNLAFDETDRVAALRADVEAYLRLPAHASFAPAEVQLDEMHLEQLRALGYLGGKH